MIITTIAGLIAAVCCIFAYRMGLRDGKAMQEGRAPDPIELPKKKQKISKEKKQAQDRLEKIIKNLEAYDGTSRGQIKI